MAIGPQLSFPRADLSRSRTSISTSSRTTDDQKAGRRSGRDGEVAPWSRDGRGQTSQRLAPHRRVQKPGLPVDPIDHGTTQDQRLAIDANTLSGSDANAADENEGHPGPDCALRDHAQYFERGRGTLPPPPSTTPQIPREGNTKSESKSEGYRALYRTCIG